MRFMHEEIAAVTRGITAGRSLCSGRRNQVRRMVAGSRIGGGRLEWE
jgi:hypothetical protein